MILFVNNNAGFTFLTYEQTVASLEIADLYQSQRIGNIILSKFGIIHSSYAIGEIVHRLIIQDINSSQKIEHIILVYIHELSIENISQKQIVKLSTFEKQKKTKIKTKTQKIYSIDLAEVTQKQDINNVNLTERSYISIDNLNQAQGINGIVLIQNYNLEILNISQSQDIESIALIVIVNITIFLDSMLNKDVGINSLMSYNEFMDSLLVAELELSSKLNSAIIVKGVMQDEIIVKSLIHEKNI